MQVDIIVECGARRASGVTAPGGAVRLGAPAAESRAPAQWSACWRSSAVSKSFLLSTASAQPSGAAPPRMSATTELKFRARLQHPQTMAPAEEEDAPGSALKARDLGDAFANPDAPRALTDAGRSGMSIMSTSPTAFKGREIRVSHAPGCRFDDHTTTKDMFPGHQPEIRCALSRRRPPRRRSIDLSPVWQQHTTAALLPRAMIASSRTAASLSFRFQKKSSSPATARSTHLPPSSRASFPRKASARP